jgi:hypothetical protein
VTSAYSMLRTTVIIRTRRALGAYSMKFRSVQ